MKELMDSGEQVYGRICAACHQPGGVGQPPTFPALKGSKVATGPIEDHINTVLNGISGTAMQAFKNQLSDVELASIITYERNAFGNNTGTMVQPIQIKALRDGKPMAEALATKPTGNAATPAAAPAAATTQAGPAPAAAPAANGTPAVNTSTTPATASPATAPSAPVAESPAPAAAPAPTATAAPANAMLQHLPHLQQQQRQQLQLLRHLLMH